MGIVSFIDCSKGTRREDFDDDEGGYGSRGISVKEGDVDTGNETGFLLEGVVG